MNFLKRYSCVSLREEDFDDNVSELGFDAAGENDGSQTEAPSSQELATELFRLIQHHPKRKHSTRALLETLDNILLWTFVACDEEHGTTSRRFVKAEVLPTILHFVRSILEEDSRDSDDDNALLNKASQIIYHCTSYHDRSTAKLEKYSKDMNIQLLKHNGVETVVQAMERYHLDDSFTGRSVFTTLWTILMNVATCDKTVSLFKYPKAMYERQEELLLDAMAAFMARAEAQVPTFWMENMLIALHRLLKVDKQV